MPNQIIHPKTPNDIDRRGVHRVVVVGAGFGGLAVAEALEEVDVEVTLVDQRNHHTFQPLLYQVATAGLDANDISYPTRRLCLLYTSPSPRDQRGSRMPSSA